MPDPAAWPADKVERRALASLIPHARNARTHSAAQVAQIAASIGEWGWTMPVLVDEGGTIIAGHGRVLAAQSLHLADVPVMVAAGWTEAQKRAYVLADNKLALNAGWDDAMLAAELTDIRTFGFDMALTGFSLEEYTALTADRSKGLTEADEVPDAPAVPASRPGDIWLLGRHRLMCGDSTAAADVAALLAGQVAHLCHADPPYGMGKEADGVLGDNVYAEDLDEFQMRWWQAFRPHLAPNASAFIWGNAADLWRLWYVGGLGDSERLALRNEIVWDKNDIAGMRSPDLTQFPVASERALFFQIGNQFLGNINIADFPETWETLRASLEAEAIAAGIKPADIRRVCGCGMYGHWFTRAQFTLIPERHYASLAAAYPGHFLRPWAEVKAEWDKVRGSGRQVINGKLDASRSYFDNAHASMRDTWPFKRVLGEDRHGHATPKPVAMMERAIVSTLPPGGLCVEPFGGTGSTLMAAEATDRACFTMELSPPYVDVTLRRWQAYTGQAATLEGDGRTYAEVATERLQLAA